MLQHEYEQKLKLQEALEQLAKDQNTLERQAKKCMHVGGSTETPGRVRIIRIYHECEGRIEKYFPRIAIWHHEACRVMTNGDPLGQICLSYPHTSNGFFFFRITVFIYFFIIFFYLFIHLF